MAASKEESILDVAVVGGGVSGIYSAWRLLTAPESPKDQNITLFEGSDRLAGRLLSATPPGIPNAHVELGGMRYTSDHIWVSSLVDHLGLPVEPFYVGEPQNIAYIRGKQLRMQDLTNADLLPYDLAPDERSPEMLATGFTAVAARRALRVVLGKDVDLSKICWKEVAKTGRYQGHKLQDLAMRYLFLRSVSHEAFEFAMATSGYDSIFHTWNAADGFPWNLADFGTHPTFHHVTSGFDELPLTVAQRFTDAGGDVEFGHWLKSFDMVELGDGTNGMELQFDSGRTVRARHLILAMPRRSLELLDQAGAVLAPENTHVHELIGSVTPIPLFKLGVCYSYPWWETLPEVEVDGPGGPIMQKITRGESVTDLPARQCYYWAVDEKSQNAVVLIYDDGLDLEYWAGLREKTELYESNLEGISDSDTAKWDENKAPQLMVEEIHRQLMIMHGVEDRTDIPKPYSAAYRDWGEDPFGGGANFWHLHVDSQKVSEEILQPKPGVPTYICGEAYSHSQGWVEGPLKTAENMLEKFFGLKQPDWLKKPDYPQQTQLAHVNLVVNDLEATRDFFVRNFGFTAGKATALEGEWVDKLNGYKNCKAEYIPLTMAAGLGSVSTTALELLKFHKPASPDDGEPGEPNKIGFRHIALKVENIEAMVKRLEKDELCYGFLSPVQTVESFGVKTVYFLGPEKVLIQLMQPIKKSC